MISFVIFGLILITFILFSHAFVVYVISEIYNKRDKIIPKILYLTLLKYIGIYIAVFVFFWLFSSFLYKLIYIIGFTYLGHFINVFMFCCIYKIIIKYTQLSPFYSKILVFLIPLIITIYSLIKAQIIIIQEETLIYPGYNNSIKIMHLSDMHLGSIYQKGSVEEIVELINEIIPDVVVITGDLSDGSKKVESEWLEPFNKIPEFIPVLYVTGNHEALYGKSDIINEINKVKKIKHIGDSDEVVNIKGVSFIGFDYEYRDVKNKATLILNKFGIKDSKMPVVLLYHVPKILLKTLNEIGVFLMMAGHTHGGQFFPFTFLAWLGNKYFNGLYNYKKSNYVFVSSGIGTALVPMRNFSSKMIGLITIKGN